jgi:hypothetical protein
MVILPDRLPAVFALVLAVVVAYAGFTTAREDLANARAQAEISFWGRGEYQPEPHTIERTGRTIEALLRQAPAHPEYLALQASYSGWRAYWEHDPERQADFAQQAVSSQYAALESRPAHRHSWSKMVEYASRTTTGEAMRVAAQARQQALQRAP